MRGKAGGQAQPPPTALLQRGLPIPRAARERMSPRWWWGARLQAFPLPQPLPLGKRPRGRAPDPGRRGGGAQAGRVALGRGPPGRERAHRAGRTAAAGTAHLTFTAVGVAPEAMPARGGDCGGGFAGPSSGARGSGSAGLSSAESRGRPWLLLFLPGTAGLAASVGSPPPPPSSIRGSRVPPLLQTFPVLRGFFLRPRSK